MSSSQFTRITGKTPKFRMNSRDWPSGTGKCFIVSVIGEYGCYVGWVGYVNEMYVNRMYLDKVYCVEHVLPVVTTKQ